MKGRHPSVLSISLCFSIHFLSIQKLLIYIFLKLCHICLQNTPSLGSQHIKSGFQFIFFSNKKLFIYILPQNFAIFVGKTRHPSVPSISNPVCFSIFFSLKTYCFPFSKQITSMLYLTVSLTT